MTETTDTTLTSDSETPSATILNEDKLLAIIDEQNAKLAELEGRISSQRRVIDGYDKAHAHEKRELWMSLRDKYACAAITALPHIAQNYNLGQLTHPQYATLVFQMADALMAARDAVKEEVEEHTAWDNCGGRAD